MKKLVINLALIGLSGSLVAGCNSGSTTPASGSGGVNSTTYTLSNSTFVLPDGAQVTLGSTILSVQPGKVTSTNLTVVGGTATKSLGLSYTVYLVSHGVYTPTNLITVSLANPDVETGLAFPSTTQVYVDASNAPDGNYAIQFSANDLQSTQQSNLARVSRGHTRIRKLLYVKG